MREPVQVIMKPEFEGNRSLDLTSKEITIEEPFPVSRVGENPVQFMQLLNVLENQENNNLSNGLHDGSAERNKQNIFLWDGVNAFPSTFNFKETIQCLEMSGTPQTGNKVKSQQIPSLTAPEAVFSLNQAVTDPNSESEKYLIGWPFVPHYNFHLIKCEKCSREFCSAINYKRHIRGHRRSQNMEKDALTNRELLEAYWDKLSPEETREILAFSKASIEDVTGTSLIITLASAFRKPEFALMPHTYVKAGSTLLDIIGEKVSATLSSQELFSVLDDASEKTFLFGGDALSFQRYIFGGNAGKIAFELRNLVACISFMLEQELVKAWLIYKETEVQRCQQLLMEEEEAAQRRQADLLERRRLKKQRQKERKVKDSTSKINADIMASSCDAVELTSRAGTLNQQLQLDDCLNPSEAPLHPGFRFLEKTRLVGSDSDVSMSSHYLSEDAVDNPDQQEQLVNIGQVPRTADCFPDQVLAETVRVELASEDANYFSKMMLNCEEPWNGRNIAHKVNHGATNTNELVIGSIIIKLEDGCEHIRDNLCKGLKSSRGSPTNSDISLNARNHSSHSSEPLSYGNSGSAIFHEKIETGVINSLDHDESTDETSERESNLLFGTVDCNDIDKSVDSACILGIPNSAIPKSSQANEAFLTQRWKDTMEAHYITLTFIVDHEASVEPETGVKCV